MLVRAAVDRIGGPMFDGAAMSRPSHIYASTVRRRRAVWPYAFCVIALLTLLVALLLA